MALTEEQKKARAGKLTASAVGYIWEGNKAKIRKLYQQLIGDPAYQDDDLSGVWPIQLGTITESLNLDWYERKIGHRISRRGEVVIHPNVSWAAATLDGWIEALHCPIECKHVGGREPFQRIVDRYTPQMHWQMDATQSSECILSVIEGANPPRLWTVERDPDFSAALWEKANEFMACVENLTPPI